MTRSKRQKNNLFRHVRRQRLKYITVLPSLVTILNGLCGFAAIVFASKAIPLAAEQFSYQELQVPYFAMSGYMILLAMIADMLDGRLARMSQSTSSFGGQLDSLCDIISFGIAPAFLMFKILEFKLASMTEANPLFVSLLQRFIWVASAAYISCAAIRLARFNVENEEDESAHMSFIGLPSPAAAGVVVSLVIFHQETLPELSSKGNYTFEFLANAIMYLLPVIVFGIAVLMVSRIRYPHVVNQYIKGKKPFAHLIRVLLFIGLMIWSHQIALVMLSCGFAASGFVKWLYHKIVRKNISAEQANDALVV
ncbi:MAG: CDP-alcohol phosphatidyltransferase family protein [Planctomycetota bacterium]|jgi:CDP-diacylglycerol--serine O-phosphatidyltransferase